VSLEQTSGSFLKRLSIAPTLLETAKKKEVVDDTGTTQTKASASEKKKRGEKHQKATTPSSPLLRVFLGLSISPSYRFSLLNLFCFSY
jgi:hypothetical protein